MKLRYLRSPRNNAEGAIRQVGPVKLHAYEVEVQRRVFRAFPNWHYRLDRSNADWEWEVYPVDASMDTTKMLEKLNRISARVRKML